MNFVIVSGLVILIENSSLGHLVRKFNFNISKLELENTGALSQMDINVGWKPRIEGYCYLV
jgi:hypothetical protein